VKEMAKCKNLIMGCGLTVVTAIMWLVSSCSPSTKESVSINPAIAGLQPGTGSTTTTEPPASTNSIPTSPTIIPDISVSAPAATNLNVDINSYSLTIDGIVNSALSLTYVQIQAYPAITRNEEIICPGVKDETDSWTGVSLSTLLKEAGLAPGASEVVFTGADGYFIELPLESVLENNVFLAYKMNGETLSQDRGYPLRLVVGKSQGADWLRWVTKIEVKADLTSFTNSSAAIQNSRSNIPYSGSKLCSCFLARAIGNYQIVEDAELPTGKNDSL
jgi:DMSO/TMAO reductase YedYZ molybdopterin-dependent catalytic subunit